MRSLFSKVIAAAALAFSVLVTPAVVSADGLSVPPADPALVFVAPTPDQPNYDARLQAFLQATVPDVWDGQHVAFFSTLDANGGVDALGLPTSGVAADPNNPNFVYERFENGVLFYNASDGTTSILSAA